MAGVRLPRKPPPPKLDDLKRPVPYVVWEWRGVEQHRDNSYRVVRVGAGKADWIVESWSGHQDGMGEPVWKMVHLSREAGPDTLDAFHAFLYMLRHQKLEGLAANSKAVK